MDEYLECDIDELVDEVLAYVEQIAEEHKNDKRNILKMLLNNLFEILRIGWWSDYKIEVVYIR